MQLLSKSLIDQKQQVGHKANLSGDELFFIKLKTHDCVAFKKLYKRYLAAVYGNIRKNISDEGKANLILHKHSVMFDNPFRGMMKPSSEFSPG